MSVLRRLGSYGLVSLICVLGGCTSDGDELATENIPTSTTPEDDARQLAEPTASTGANVGSGDGTDVATAPSTSVPSVSDSSTTTDAGDGTTATSSETTEAAASASSSTAAPEDTPNSSTAPTTGAATSTTDASSTTAVTTSTSTTTTTTSSTTSTTSTTTQAPASFPSRIDLPAEVSSTEGVASDPATGRLFVGELNNGNVWAGTPTGGWALFNSGSAAGRATAFGLAVDASRNRLYVVSGVDGRVDVLNLASGSLVASIPVPVAGGSLINDIGVAPDGTVYVTDTGAARLYRIAAGGSSAQLWVDYSGQVDTDRTQHGNGVVADGAVVLVAYMERGELLRFDRSSGAVSVVSISGAATAGRDGLVLCGNRLYGVEISSITGTEGVWVTDLNAARTSGTSQGRIGASELAGASTVAALDGHLVVNNAQFGVTPKYTPFDLTTLDSSC